MSVTFSQEHVYFAHQLADTSKEILRKYFRKTTETKLKNDLSVVSIADSEVESTLRNLIEKKFPDHGIIGEEFAIKKTSSEFEWIIDPIDGTGSFVTGKPTFGTLIALVKNQKPIIGIIDQPINSERWVGEIYKKTTFNGKDASCSNKKNISEAYLDATNPEMFSKKRYSQFCKLLKEVKLNRWGYDCYAYGMLASGYVDIVCETGLKIYDFVPLVPIIEGSGGIISDWNGKNLDISSDGSILAAANPELHKKALTILNL
tara:strand:- start:573 stop:1352 length:780 start_codon:yes stop_codon:yes gene_type:complete